MNFRSRPSPVSGRAGRARSALAAAALILVLLLIGGGAARAASREPPFKIYYQGRELLVLKRLKLDPSTRSVHTLSAAQAAVFQGELPPPGPALDALKARVRAGMGMVLILGAHVDPAALDALTGGRIQQTGAVEAPAGPAHARNMEGLAAPIRYAGPDNDPLYTDVSWRSAVRVYERSLLKLRGVEVLVATTKKDPVKPGTAVVMRVRLGKGTLYVLNVWLKRGDQRRRLASYIAMLKGIRGAENYDFQRWAFFNWLLYYFSRASAGVKVVRFGQWVAAPVPDAHDVVLLGLIFGGVFIVFVILFLISRRYSNRHPEALERFYLPRRSKPAPASLGAAAAPQPEEQKPSYRGDPRWEVVGFHRPLSGFFYNYLLALLVMIPFNFVVTFYLERNFVNPFLEARGAWAAVTQFLLFFFTLLDLGTGQAMVKYFAEFRVKEPARAITYAQFFIWFHALGGMLQVTVLGLIAAIWMPHTTLAFMTWFVVLGSLTQFPGFVSIFSGLFRALQRFDYAQLIIVLTYVMNPVIQLTCAIFARHWGLAHPAIGEGVGVVIGYAIGGMIANVMMGIFCAIFYHGVGFRLTTIFLSHFNWDTIKRAIVYGAKLTGGNLAGAISWGMVPIIMGILLPNFLALNEIWILTYSLTFAYIETGAYIFTTLMPSISESYSQGKHALTRRYLDQGLKWGVIVSTMLGGAFVAFSDIFVKGLLPPQFMRAVGVMALMHIWRVFDFSTRLPDQVFQGVGRTGVYTWTAVVEYAGRVVLSWYLIKWFGFPGLFYAFMLSSILKSLLAWPLMGKLVVWPAISLWQTIINPTLSMLGNYLILRAIILEVWRGPGHVGSTWLGVLICLFGSLPVYMFITGLLGWDSAAMADFRIAAELVPPPFGSIARGAFRLVEFGTILSPLHDRFPGRLIKEAAEEAAAITAAKAEMH